MSSPARSGAKGFALNQLIRMGATVPPTGSIATGGYRWFVRDSGLERFIDELRREGLPDQADLVRAAERVDSAFLDAEIPGALAAAIRELAAAVGGGALLAVRSSATPRTRPRSLCRLVSLVSRDRRRGCASPRGQTGVSIVVASRPASPHRGAGR